MKSQSAKHLRSYPVAVLDDNHEMLLPSQVSFEDYRGGHLIEEGECEPDEAAYYAVEIRSGGPDSPAWTLDVLDEDSAGLAVEVLDLLRNRELRLLQAIERIGKEQLASDFAVSLLHHVQGGIGTYATSEPMKALTYGLGEPLALNLASAGSAHEGRGEPLFWAIPVSFERTEGKPAETIKLLDLDDARLLDVACTRLREMPAMVDALIANVRAGEPLQYVPVDLPVADWPRLGARAEPEDVTAWLRELASRGVDVDPLGTDMRECLASLKDPQGGALMGSRVARELAYDFDRLRHRQQFNVRHAAAAFMPAAAKALSAPDLSAEIPVGDDDYGDGFREALEAVTLALRHRGVAESDIHDAITTALDAFGNNADNRPSKLTA